MLDFDQQGHCVTLTINRPDMRNALGEPGDADVFADACARINQDRSVRCVVLTGTGSAFSSGGNIKAMQERRQPFDGTGAQIAESYRRGIHQIVRNLWDLEVPIIAAVNGPAIGLGNDVASLCDIRIAAKSAVFGATFLKIGLIPGDGGSWLLPRQIGLSRASELLFTGKTIDAETAAAWGLVSHVVDDDELMPAALEMAAEISAQSPEALRAAKRLLRHGQTASFETLMEMSATTQALMHQMSDHQTAISAMLDKTQADYKDE